MKAKLPRGGLRNSTAAEKASVKSRFDAADVALSQGDLMARKPKTETPLPPSPIAKQRGFNLGDEGLGLLEKILVRLAKQGSLSNKSEVVRAGLHALDRMTDTALAEALQKTPKMPRGQKPKKR